MSRNLFSPPFTIPGALLPVAAGGTMPYMPSDMFTSPDEIVLSDTLDATPEAWSRYVANDAQITPPDPLRLPPAPQ